jgi:hypothetical protein
MGKAGILNPNGADLDGRLTISGDVLFDIKAFGLHEHLSNRLQERLSGEFSSQFAAIEGSADVAVSVMTDLLGRDYGLACVGAARKRTCPACRSRRESPTYPTSSSYVGHPGSTRLSEEPR